MLSSLGLIGFSNKKANHNNHEPILSSMSEILPYLEEEDHLSLKLTCKAFHYWFIASQVWMGLKMEVAEQKMEHYEDFQFEENEPKQISKRDKNIRIHSLKKQSENKIPKRESSNIKQKGKAIMANNELLFRNTEIGFKRLLKTNNSQRKSALIANQPQSEDMYAIGDPEQYLIKINEPWSVNMKKAQKLIVLIKKFNEFHHNISGQMRSSCKEMHYLYIRVKENEEKIKQYARRTTSEPLLSILQSTEGANQGLLIDEQLNKVCKLFWNNHPSALTQANQIDALAEFCQQQNSTMQKLKNMSETSSIGFLEAVSSIEQLANNFGSFTQKYPVVGKQLCSVFVGLYCASLELKETCDIYFDETSPVQLRALTWKDLVSHSFFFETLFQIINSLCMKLLKLVANYCAEDLTIAINQTKLKNLKNVSQSIVNVSKYFGKLRKQLEEKKMRAKAGFIKDFLSEYEMRNSQFLYQVKNTVKLDKWISELKDKIADLKTKMQSQ